MNMNMNMNTLQQEIAKYADINHIFDTVTKRGYLNKLSSFLEDIYRSEISFAQSRLKEVIQVMKKQGAKVDYSLQLARNIQIFRSNFDLILNTLSNQIWGKLLQQLQEMEEIAIITRTDTIPSSIRKNDNQNRYSEPDLKCQSFSRSPSKISSSILKQQQQIPLSEISCVSGGSPTTFSKARRNLDQSLTTSSPGVGKYKIDTSEKHVRQSSPQISIGRSAKISWIDEKLQKEDSQSPGPIYNPVKTYCSKKIK